MVRPPPQLYGFPVLHPLDPLSRVDLELPEATLAAMWPRARACARGAAVVLEAGDALVMPQGVWHQVHSLDAQNISANLLFGLLPAERPEGAAQGMVPPPVVGQLPPCRRDAALAEAAKNVEVFVVRSAGAQHCHAAFSKLVAALGARDERAPHGAEADDDDDNGFDVHEMLPVVQAFLQRSLAGGPAEGLPTVQEFVRDYLDVRRFAGLPVRAPSRG